MSGNTTDWDAYPAPDEIAVVYLPPAGTVHIHQADKVRTHHADNEQAVIVAPGDRDQLGWGVHTARYGGLSGVRNGKRKDDRPVWHEAARLVRTAGIVYIRHD